jgi:diguanylate cyclase (GGDEF)-like protein
MQQHRGCSSEATQGRRMQQCRNLGTLIQDCPALPERNRRDAMGKYSDRNSKDKLTEYYNYKLLISRKYLGIVAFIAAVFNLMLMVPDLTLIDGVSKKASIVIIRSFFSLILFGVLFLVKRIKTFRVFSIIITACELFSIANFLFVFILYDSPDLLIQAMGMITIVIIAFTVPNRWVYMLVSSILGLLGFVFCASFFIESGGLNEFAASTTYISIAVVLCAISAWNTEKHQRKEFFARDELKRIGTTDYLTNTANRFKIEEEADRWIDFCKRNNLPLCLVFIDVDNLKSINDIYGHYKGDSVLTEMANLIHGQLHGSDVLARWGGDEFVLLLPNVTLENAVGICERIRESISNYDFVKDVKVTCSFGVVAMRENSVFESMIRESDKLMYRGKRLGKNVVISAT